MRRNSAYIDQFEKISKEFLKCSLEGKLVDLSTGASDCDKCKVFGECLFFWDEYVTTQPKPGQDPDFFYKCLAEQRRLHTLKL